MNLHEPSMRWQKTLSDTDFGGVHNDGGYKVEEDVVAVCADSGVAESHLQLIHSFQQKSLSLIL